MTKITRLTNADYVREPWKNGGGTTTATSRSTAATSRSPPGDTLRVDDAAASTISVAGARRECRARACRDRASLVIGVRVLCAGELQYIESMAVHAWRLR